MTIRNDLTKLENDLGIIYPSSFISCIEELSIVFATEGFRQIFRDSKLILSVSDFIEARRIMPDDLIPFMSEENSIGPDIYAIEVNSGNEEFRVVVWSDHSIVNDWINFSSFIIWVHDLIEKRGTVA